MSKTGFTPGPWFIEPSRRDIIYIGDERDNRLLECPGSGGALSYTNEICRLSWIGGVHEANARLIAAAPAMYKALEAMLDPLKDAQAYEALRIVRAALSRARGETEGRE